MIVDLKIYDKFIDDLCTKHSPCVGWVESYRIRNFGSRLGTKIGRVDGIGVVIGTLPLYAVKWRGVNWQRYNKAMDELEKVVLAEVKLIIRQIKRKRKTNKIHIQTKEDNL